MAPDNRHDAWLKFARAILDVPLGRSKEDMCQFLDVAQFEHPALVPVIKAYLDLAERSSTNVKVARSRSVRISRNKQKHLFDLLREKTFFPRNIDLARFATRVMPELKTDRFDKLSRSEIAARIIEYIEEREPKMQEKLETSMREALDDLSGRQTHDVERKSFLSKWERIIKGDAD